MTRPATRHRLDLLAPVRTPLVLAVILQAVAAALALLPVLALIGYAGAWVSGEPTPGGGVVLAAVLATVGAALAAAAATWIAHRADADLTLDLQRRLADTVRHVPVPAVTGQGAARIKKVVQDDTGALHYLVAHTLLDATALVATPVAGLAALALIDWRLAVCSLVPLALGIGWFVRAMRGSGANFRRYAAEQQAINGSVVDYVHGLPAAKVYGGAGGARTRFHAAVTGFHDFFRAWSGGTSAVTTASWLVVAPAVTLTALTAAGVLGLGAGLLDPAALVAGVLLGPAVSAPVAVAGPRLQAVRTGLAALASIGEFLDQPRLHWGARGTPQGEGGVRLEGVGHRYGEDRPAVADLTLDLPRTGLVAMVGASGSGKSTVATLLARFADPAQGRVLLGGTDLRELTEEGLYDAVGFVFQDTGLRRASIRDNLTGGRATDPDRIADSLRQAAIDEEIRALPGGLDTVLGVAVDLSGGQRQRLCLARALLREPRLLVLDEALSAVDEANRARLLTTLREHAAHRAVLLITHHPEAAAAADRVLVLDEGRIVGDGTHDELLRDCPAYRDRQATALARAGEGH